MRDDAGEGTRTGVPRRAWRAFVSGGCPPDASGDHRRRVHFFNVFLSLTVFALLLFGLYNLGYKDSVNGIVELSIAGLGALNLLLFRRTRDLAVAQNITFLLCLGLFTLLLYRGGIAKTGLYWWFALPAGTFYLTGRRRGWVWMGAIFALLGTTAGLSAAGAVSIPYSLVELRQFSAAFFLASLLAYAYERLREDYESLAERRTGELAEANRRLEGEVEARERANDQLEEARLEADRANRAKSEFLSRMSHELRTPLNAILGFSQLLEMEGSEPLTDRQRECVGQISTAGNHLLSLINEVLDLARIESGRLTLSPEPVEVAPLVAEALAMIRPLADGRRLTLRDRTGGGPGAVVLADARRLRQILINLLSNAVKYNREGGLITVECLQEEGGFRIQVSDTGEGIPPEKADSVFEPFQRLGGEAETVEGTGIGLTVVKKLAEAMGGTVGLASSPGLGSCFSVALPAGPPAVPEAPPRPAREPAPGGGSGGRPRRVLYVEDDAANLTLVRHILARRQNIDLLHAGRGDQGLALAREHRPDLVLLDIHLPDTTGHEVFAELRADPSTRGIPVVVVSASAMPGDIERVRAAGVADYLTKPLDVALFLGVLDRFLGASGGTETGAG